MKIQTQHLQLRKRIKVASFVFLLAVVALFALFHSSKNPLLLTPFPKKPDPLLSLEPGLSRITTQYRLTNAVQNSLPGDYDNASAYIVVDYDSGTVLAEKNSTDSLPIASLTKLMTAVVALDTSKPQSQFTIYKAAEQVEPTKIGVIAGQKMQVSELLAAMLLTSANDAAETVRDNIDAKYGSGIFVRAMNEKARILGLESSHFANPQGFDSEKNYSSAHDLAILTHYALNNYPLISDLVAKDYEFVPANSTHKQFERIIHV